MRFETFKAGVLRKQYQYKSFEPVLVNHEWIWEDPTINLLLESASRALGELNAFSLIVPDIDLFISMHVAKEAQGSPKGIAETAAKGRDTFRQILTLRTEVEHAVLGLGRRAPAALQALNLLYRQPVVTALDIQNALQVVKTTANKVVQDFIRLGILAEKTGLTRGRVYVFDRYVKLFSN